MKTKEELTALKEEVETLNKKLAELSEEEMEQVTGGIAPGRPYWKRFCGPNIGPDGPVESMEKITKEELLEQLNQWELTNVVGGEDMDNSYCFDMLQLCMKNRPYEFCLDWVLKNCDPRKK